jgi:DNA helicase-2/ATP-dependent DNA helicase PcrA
MANYKLNEAQKQAVEYFGGPLIIVAGAGTGKTTVITEKISHILKNNLATADEVLALTFTEKAATEMFDRVDAEIDIGYVDLQISTFHAFCQKILEEYGLQIGLSQKFKLITETDAWLLARQNLDKFNLNYYRPMGNPASHLHALISHFQKCKDELITPKDYLKYAEEAFANQDNIELDDQSRLTEIANAYHVYNQLLLDNNALDFADLIFYTTKLLKERPTILKTLQKKFKFILIDEFQDVNWSQYQMVRLLTGETSQLTVVGDDDQSIYAFRGASVSNILRFKDDFPQAKEIVLNENYRSQQEILDYAYKLIQNNNPDRLEVKLNVNKKLIFTGEKKQSKAPAVVHIHCATLNEEVKKTLEEIATLKHSNLNTKWSDFAILVRANNHSEPFISALEKLGMPYEFLAASGLYRQPLVLDCLNFFKLLDNYLESTAMFRLLLLPVWKIDDHDLQKITYNAKRKAISFYESLKYAEQFGLSPQGIETANKLIAIINSGLKNAKKEKPTTVLFHFLQDSGMLEYLTKEELNQNTEVIRQIHQLKEFFEYIKNYETNVMGATVVNFLEHFNYVIESGDPGGMYQASDNTDAINIITVHKSKGLEFKYVFVVNMVEDRFPGRRRGESIELPSAFIKEKLPEGDSHYQEERRLFYVAITRAKERLYLTSADDYGGVKNKKISRFLPELGFNVLEKNTAQKEAFKLSTPTKHKDDAEFVYELPKVFSFSQIKAYRTCPYQYKLAHILRIPTSGSASFSFGQSMHSTMQKFYERLKELNQVTQTSLFAETPVGEVSRNGIKAPSLDELLAFYEESWIGDWYQDAAQKATYYKTGKEILRAFYESEKENWTVPVTMEGWFKIKIGEHLVHGRIDRIDQSADGSLEIIDYKTGKSKEKLESEDKDQLLIYQIAVNQLPQYNQVGNAGKLTYFYLNDNVKLSFLGTEKEIEKLKEKMISTMSEIKSGNFKATPSAQVCKNCDFRNICQFRA